VACFDLLLLDGGKVKQLLIILGYAFVLASLRLVDSLVTHALVSSPTRGIKELNPFAKTDGLLAVFLSPVLLTVTLLVLGLFIWMVYHPMKILDLYEDKRPSIWSTALREIIDIPFLTLAFIALAVVNNTSLLVFNRPLLPGVINDFMVSSPVIGLICLVAALSVLGGNFFKGAMLTILRHVARCIARR
jgi:hypothetical protein